MNELTEIFANLNLLKQGKAAADLVGMPWEHVQVFKQAARSANSVISSRQLGRVCTTLMSEGYDTKGFRMHSKSCDFGPMAGFICVDERLHKKGAAYNPTQQKDVRHALHGDKWDRTGKWRASTIQICLSDARLQELSNWSDPDNRNAQITPISINDTLRIGTVTTPVNFHYVLRKEQRNGDRVWALYYTDKPLPRASVAWRAHWDIIVGSYDLKPLESLVNPYPAYVLGHYKNACTGDYDLFGIWPKKRYFQPMGEDRRIAGMPQQVNGANAQIAQWEDQRTGNISDRVHTVGQTINSLMHSTIKGGHGAARDVVHHSDEAGRPFISGIDDHVIAFIPGLDMVVGLESPGGHPIAAQWAGFFKAVNALGFQLVLNVHWKAQMNAWGVGNLGTLGDSRGVRSGFDDPGRST
ncbi:MAG: hypothetical protein ACI9NT_002438 [Bacteroidia bacterium]|jgi:hypothetical protein